MKKYLLKKLDARSCVSTIVFCILLTAFCTNLFASTNFLFIHHSVGYNWLYEGELLNYLTHTGFNVHDTDYGDIVPGTSDPNHNPIGDFTDVSDWYFWFHNHLNGILNWECISNSENKIVMFKSCYPNSAIYEIGSPPGNPTNENATTWNYNI